MLEDLLELMIPPTNGPAVQRLARPSGIRETHGSIPGLALSFLLPQDVEVGYLDSDLCACEVRSL